MASRDPITCHVLDTTTGRPAANITVTLICCSQPTSKFTATTNSDGRIANWKFGGASETLPEASIDKLITSYASKEETANCRSDLDFISPTALWQKCRPMPEHIADDIDCARSKKPIADLLDFCQRSIPNLRQKSTANNK